MDTRSVINEMNAIAAAKAEVEAVIRRPLLACDDVGSAYLQGLRALGHTTPIPASAARAMFRKLRNVPAPKTLAMDRKASIDAARFPGVGKLKLRGG